MCHLFTGAILLPEGNYWYNGGHIPGYKDIAQIQIGTEEHVPHYGNYYGNLQQSKNGDIRRGGSQRSANPRNNVKIGRQIYSQGENYDAAYLNRGLNLLMSSYDKGHVGFPSIASYREVETLKGRNAEYGFDNGNKYSGGRNNKPQTSRDRNRYTDAHRNRGESGYKTGNVFAKGSRFTGGQVSDYKGRIERGFIGNDHKRQYRNGLMNQRGNDDRGRQIRVSIRKEYRNRDRYNGETGIDYGKQNLYRGEGRRHYGLEERKYGSESEYRNLRENPSVNYNTYFDGKGNQFGIGSVSGDFGHKNEHESRIAFDPNAIGNKGRNRHRIATSDLDKSNNIENKYQSRGINRGGRQLNVHRSREIRYVVNSNRYPRTSKTSHQNAGAPVNSQNVNRFSGRNEKKWTGSVLYRSLF